MRSSRSQEVRCDARRYCDPRGASNETLPCHSLLSPRKHETVFRTPYPPTGEDHAQMPCWNSLDIMRCRSAYHLDSLEVVPASGGFVSVARSPRYPPNNFLAVRDFQKERVLGIIPSVMHRQILVR